MWVAPKYEEFTYNRRVPEQELLHKVLVEHLETFLAQMRTEDHDLPKYVEQELRDYVECGILGKGFLRVWCKDCNRSRAVAFSCKGRGFCPSCTARRLAGDGFRWGVDLVILLGTVMALILLDADHHRSGAFSPEVPVLMLLAATGMMMLTAARDLMFVFLGIELMSLALYILAGVNRRSARGAEAAVKYFLLGAVASGFLLYGMALLFGATGSTRLVDIAQWVAAHPTLSPMFLVGTGLLLVGFAFKVAAAPMTVKGRLCGGMASCP